MPCCNLLEIDCATGLLWPAGPSPPAHLNFSGYAPWIAAGEASRGPHSHSDAALCISVVVLRT